MIPCSTVLLTATGYTVNGAIPAKVYIDSGLTTEMTGGNAAALAAATSVYLKFGVPVKTLAAPKLPSAVDLDFLYGDRVTAGQYNANGCIHGLAAGDSGEWDVDCNVVKLTTYAGLGAGVLQIFGRSENDI
jgi:hypothetical protein